MKRWTGIALLGMLALLAAVFLLPAETPGASAAPGLQAGSQGQQIYEERCAACHGINGDGQGPGAENFFIKPRDFTRDEYKIKSTEGDEFPSQEDLVQVISEGMPGSSMPAWEGVLSGSEIEAVADYIQSFGRFFSQEGYGTTPIEVPRRISPSEESIEQGRILFQEEIECFQCHGLVGRGDGPSAFELTDNAGFVTYPTDLTQPWLFRGGGDPEDIYLRLRTGLTGSPMPSFADGLTEEDTWHIINYILSLSPEEAPEPAVLVTAGYVEGSLPSGLDDPAWAELVPAYYPLSGQIMRSPRYYQPSIQAIEVRSLYNDSEIAFLLTWNDRTETRDGETVDALALQFPAELEDGNQRPYFVFGDSARAVYQWYWSAGTDSVTERNANGIDAVSDQGEDQQQVAATARFQDGQWQLLLRRPLQTGQAGDVGFETNHFIPVSFMVWDGFVGESGTDMGLTSWSQLYLPTPTPLIEYARVPVVIIIAAAVELFVVWQVRRTTPNARRMK
jgi:DMSO reductase family type II enzyme heme b subunit